MEKRDEFDFDATGEAIENYISLDQAVLQARRLVRQDEARYLERLNWDEIVWAETSSESREDSYRVVLQFRRPARGLREEQTGEEEFLNNLTGVLQDRQVLLWPEGLIAGEGTLDNNAPEVEDETSTTEPPLLQCAHCMTEYSLNQEFCTGCGAGVSDATLSAHSAMPASTPFIQSDDRSLGTSSPIGRASLTGRLRKIGAIVLGLWGAFILIGGGFDLPQEDQLIWGNLLIMAGGVATMLSAGMLWPWTKPHFGRLGSRWVIIVLAVGGFVAFVVGAVLTSE